MTSISRSEYCLYCYAPMVSTRGASQRCARCGRVHLRIDHATFWSREPRLVWIERGVKSVILIAILAWFILLAGTVGMGPHRVNTFFVGPLLMLGGVLWWTAGLITRKARYFSPRLLWGTVLSLLVVGTPVLLFVMDVIARKETFGAGYWRAYLTLASPAAPMLILALIMQPVAKSFEDYKRQRIEAGVR